MAASDRVTPRACAGVLLVAPSWLTVRCEHSGAAAALAAGAAPAANAINESVRVAHASAFGRFVPAAWRLDSTALIDFLGVRYPVSTYCNRKCARARACVHGASMVRVR